MKAKAEKTDENRSKRNVGPLLANPFLVNTNQCPNAPSRISNRSSSSFKNPDFTTPSSHATSRKPRRYLLSLDLDSPHSFERPQPVKRSNGEWSTTRESSPLSSPTLHEVPKHSSSSVSQLSLREADRSVLSPEGYQLCSQFGILGIQDTPSPQSRTAPHLRRAISLRMSTLSNALSSPSESEGIKDGVILLQTSKLPSRRYSMDPTYRPRNEPSSPSTLYEPPPLSRRSPIALDDYIEDLEMDLDDDPPFQLHCPEARHKKKRRLSVTSCSPELRPWNMVDNGSPVPPPQRRASVGGGVHKKLKTKQ